MVLVKSGFFLQSTDPAIGGVNPDPADPRNEVIVGFTPKIIMFWLTDAYDNAVFRDGSGIAVAFIDSGPGPVDPPSESVVAGAELSINARDGTSVNGTGAAGSELTNISSLARVGYIDTAGTGPFWSQLVVECITDCGFICRVVVNEDELPIIVNYMVIGGDDLEVFPVNWATPFTTPAVKTITGVPFEPDLVINTYHGGTGSIGVDLTFNGIDSGLSMFTPTDQWVLYHKKFNTTASSDYFRIHRGDASFISYVNSGLIRYRGNFQSMNADGFSIDFVTVGTAASNVFSLCVKGGNWDIGSISPGGDISGLPFAPGLFALFSAYSDATGMNGLRFGIGAGDSEYQASVSFESQEAISPRNVSSYTERDTAFTVVDNDTKTIDAQASLVGFTGDGVNFSWTGSGSQQIFYLVGEAEQQDDVTVDDLLLSLSQFTVEVAYTGEEQEPPPPPPVEPTVCLSTPILTLPACPELPAASRPIARTRLGFTSLPLCRTLPSASHPAPRSC